MGEATETYITSSVADGIGTITLTHAVRRNALSHGMMDPISVALAGFQKQSVRVAIIQAEKDANPFGGDTSLGPQRLLVAVHTTE